MTGGDIYAVLVALVAFVGFVAFGLRFGSSNGGIETGVDSLGFEPIVAAATSFVAFQGWRLLRYSQSTIEDHSDTT
ncbi:hypothetical protein ACFQE1_10545 [Halobium palmae]|uniref:Uncharacterized protein n=1 Tax=Halobium palmae TaxID=1776492 RepID=A0ABD5RZS5_9EURY